MQTPDTARLWRDFGAWIREHRETKHFSQAGAAQRAGIDRQQWYRIENGKSGTRRDTVIAIANALSLNVKEALERAGFSAVDNGKHQKPQNVAEFVQRLGEMGFDIQLSGEDLEGLGPDDLQDMIEQIETNLLIKSRRRKNR